MRVLVTGGAGFVGRRLAKEFNVHGHTVAVTAHENDPELADAETVWLDIRDEIATAKLVASFDPDLIVHAAAISDADTCEQNPELARAVNVNGTKHIATSCERFNSTLVFISSSFVFSGADDIYREHDERSPVNVYGETKADAEDVVTGADCRSLIVRTDQPYGWSKPWQPPSMVEWVLNQLSEDGPVPVFTDWWNNPIYILDLVLAILELVRASRTGVFHTVGPEFLHRYDWARRIASAFDYDPDRIEQSTATNSSLPAERPNARLSIEKLREDTGLNPCGVDEGIRRIATE